MRLKGEVKQSAVVSGCAYLHVFPSAQSGYVFSLVHLIQLYLR